MKIAIDTHLNAPVSLTETGAFRLTYFSRFILSLYSVVAYIFDMAQYCGACRP